MELINLSDYKMGPAEGRFADLIWENEPLTSGQLARLGAAELSWKKTTCFTVLKRLCDRDIFQNQGGTVTSRISRKEFYARSSEEYVEETFGGSLPAFLAAFGTRKQLSDTEVEELKKLIEAMRGQSHV